MQILLKLFHISERKEILPNLLYGVSITIIGERNSHTKKTILKQPHEKEDKILNRSLANQIQHIIRKNIIHS